MNHKSNLSHESSLTCDSNTFFRCHCNLLGVCFSTLLQMNINEICWSKMQPCTVWQPWRITWNIIMEVWKIIFLSKWVIWRFHVNLPGCNFKLGNIFCFVTCFHPMVFSVPFFSMKAPTLDGWIHEGPVKVFIATFDVLQVEGCLRKRNDEKPSIQKSRFRTFWQWKKPSILFKGRFMVRPFLIRVWTSDLMIWLWTSENFSNMDPLKGNP